MRTGRFGFRRNWRGKLILTVEVRSLQQHTGLYEFTWIDGTNKDAADVLEVCGNRFDKLGHIAKLAAQDSVRRMRKLTVPG